MASARRERLRQLREKLKQREEPIVITLADFARPRPEAARSPQEPPDASTEGCGSPDDQTAPQGASPAPTEALRWHRCEACGARVRCGGGRR